MHRNDIKRAEFSKFKTLRAPLLFGQYLTDVKKIERSILKYGLILPIIVTESQGKLIVADGKKRLAAIRRMMFTGNLPRSLTSIPYSLLADSGKIDPSQTELGQTETNMARLLSAYDIYDSVMRLKMQVSTIEDIADALFLCRRSVQDIISLSHLALPIRKAFFKQTLTFEQAKAYATLPDEDEQIAILTALGPFATAEEILKTIRHARFETIAQHFSLAENNVVTLPQTPKTYVWEQAA